MKLLSLFGYIFILGCVTSGFADELQTLNGIRFHNIRITQHDACGINIIYAGGAAYIQFTNLPSIIQQQYNYDPAKCAAESNARWRSEVLQNQRAEQERRRHNELAVYHSSIMPEAQQRVQQQRTPAYYIPSAPVVSAPPRSYSSGSRYSRDYSTRSYGRVYVRGYRKSDGTWVSAHWRERP